MRLGKDVLATHLAPCLDVKEPGGDRWVKFIRYSKAHHTIRTYCLTAPPYARGTRDLENCEIVPLLLWYRQNVTPSPTFLLHLSFSLVTQEVKTANKRVNCFETHRLHSLHAISPLSRFALCFTELVLLTFSVLVVEDIYCLFHVPKKGVPDLAYQTVYVRFLRTNTLQQVVVPIHLSLTGVLTQSYCMVNASHQHIHSSLHSWSCIQNR